MVRDKKAGRDLAAYASLNTALYFAQMQIVFINGRWKKKDGRMVG